MNSATGTVLALALLLAGACGDNEDAAPTVEEAVVRVSDAVEAAVEAAGDVPADDGQDVTLPEAAEGLLDCDGAPAPEAVETSRLQVGPDDVLVVHAAAFADADVASAVAAGATPDCAADAWAESTNDALRGLGLPGDIAYEGEGNDGVLRVTGELAGFPVGFEGRVGAEGNVVVVVLGGGGDVDGEAAGMVDAVLAAALEAVG